MWKIIKSEYQYHKYFLLTVCVIAVALPVMVGIVESRKAGHLSYETPAVLFVMGMATFLVSILGFIGKTMRKRDRLYALLPLPSWKIALSRILFGYLYWASLVILFFISLLFVRPDDFVMRHSHFQSSLLWDLIALNGFLVILMTNYLLSRDLTFFFRSDMTLFKVPVDYIPGLVLNLLGVFFIVSIAILNSFHVEPLRRIIFSTLVSPHGALSLNIVALVMVALSVYVFTRRKSYLL